MPETPHPIDTLVGQGVRRERKAAGWTQQQLAASIGVTFQQLQKYERGFNRISSSKLWEISKALGVRVAVFFGEEDREPLAAPDQALARHMRTLNADGRRTVRSVIEALEQPD